MWLYSMVSNDNRYFFFLFTKAFNISILPNENFESVNSLEMLLMKVRNRF